ncbi:CinA family protein [Petrimonas sulfuriphila]|jgi:PncC family amidohydrolase|uniref:CinA family protein n=1 Tax=Petrimonas sulfuriphila TaxID=285070 RepID=UPI003EBB8E75
MEMNIFKQKINEISKLLQKRNQTIAIAESCTSGLLQNAFSQAENATFVFQGGMTLYNLGQKTKHLNVNPVMAEACNSVGKNVSEKMALEIVLSFTAEIGIGITGYAQPFPKMKTDDTYAFIAISEKSKIKVSKRITGEPTKTLFENQRIFLEKSLNELLKMLKK